MKTKKKNFQNRNTLDRLNEKEEKLILLELNIMNK